VGFVLCAPLGPVGVLCLQRTITAGRLAGFFSILGAAVVDGFYGMVAGFGMSLVGNMLDGGRFWFQLFGGVMLVGVGFRLCAASPIARTSQDPLRDSLGAFLSTSALMLSNPLPMPRASGRLPLSRFNGENRRVSVAQGLRAKILILSASVGGGHLRAAEAMESALRQTAPAAAIRNIDVLTLANKAFRRIYGKGYLDFANRAPHFLGYVYDLLDRPKEKEGEFEPDRLRVALEKLNMQPFLKLLQSESWDMVVNTHFLPAEIIGSLRSSGRISVPQVTVTTDFMTHRLWVQEPCEHYFAATVEGAVYLNSCGVDPDRISVTGIPIHPVFCRRKGRSECLEAQGLSGDRPIVLLLSGGFGVGPIEQLFQAALTVASPIEIAVVCGRNEELHQKLVQQPSPQRHRVVVLGYTTRIDELMAVADVVISKPGGLTSAEVLARGSVLAIVNPIPGQESRNSDYLLENGAAIKIGPVATLPFKVETLLNDPRRLARLKTNAQRLGRPRAAFAVADKVLSLIHPE